MNTFDIVVVGGGMVGSAAACALAMAGRRVAVIESAPLADFLDDDFVDLRVSAISPVSQALLDELDVWSAVEPRYRCAYEVMRVWDAQVPPASADVLCFDSAEIGAPNLGHIVENRRIVYALQQRLRQLQTVELYAPANAQRIDLADDSSTISLDDGRQISARLVVAADGAGSWTRTQAGIETRGWPYAQKAVVTHIRTERPHRETAWQRFMPDGPIALLPLYDGRVSIVWSTTEQHAEQLLKLDEPDFIRSLDKATDGALGAVQSCDRRAAFPLQLLHAEHYVRPRLALIGDAAHAVHPLAGQGVNLGFADVVTLCDALSGAADPGELSGLRRYERTAKSDNLIMIAALEGIHRIFTNDAPVAERLRSASLALLNRVAPAKRILIRRAMGY